MSEHCYLEHALAIQKYMPERPLKVGDRVASKNTQDIGTVIEIVQTSRIGEYVVVRFPESATSFHRDDLILLYTFTEIWEQLPNKIPYDGKLARLGITKNREGITFTEYSFQRSLGNDLAVCGSVFNDIIPSNAAAELLKWVKERKMEVISMIKAKKTSGCVKLEWR